MRVGIDIDDVLFPWYDKAHALCEAAGIANGVLPRRWAMHEEYGVDLQVWLDVLEAGTTDGTLYHGDPYPGAVEALQRLRDAGHTIHLVTARGFFSWGDLIRGLTVQWLSDHAVPHDSLTFSKDKTLVRCDVFADDGAHNIAQLAAAGVPCCLIEQPHNSEVVHGWRARNIGVFADDMLCGRGRWL